MIVVVVVIIIRRLAVRPGIGSEPLEFGRDAPKGQSKAAEFVERLSPRYHDIAAFPFVHRNVLVRQYTVLARSTVAAFEADPGGAIEAAPCDARRARPLIRGPQLA